MDRHFWRGRRVLITGNTGFKGSWLSLWMQSLGAQALGFALPPHTSPSLWDILSSIESVQGDILNVGKLDSVFSDFQPQIVIHMAAQSLVRMSYREPVNTYAANVMGTVNILEACRRHGKAECIVVITSDKVYANDGTGRLFAETDRLGGDDPYSSSKACAEVVTRAYRKSFFSSGASLATARAGNVIGGGDWSEDRLVPDCWRALQSKNPVLLRNPDAIRPWQHVLDPLCGYIALAETLVKSSVDAPKEINFGPDPTSFASVRTVVDKFSSYFEGRPGWIRDSGSHPPEAPVLMLTSDVARAGLGWKPRLGLDEAIEWTADWYLAYSRGSDMRQVSLAQIHAYEAL